MVASAAPAVGGSMTPHCPARLALVATLRGLGLGLAEVREVAGQKATLAAAALAQRGGWLTSQMSGAAVTC